MKFLFYLLTVFSFLFPVLAEDTLGERASEIVEEVESVEREGAGVYFSTDIFPELGFSVGHQFRLSDRFGFRVAVGHRPLRFEFGVPVIHEMQRYGGFLDLRLADSENFIYIGSAWSRGKLVQGASLETGVVWRVTDRFAVDLGHQYRDWGQFAFYDLGNADAPPNHTFRVGLIHFFRKSN